MSTTWTPEQEKRFRHLIEVEGKTYGQAAKVLGFSRSKCTAKGTRMGLKNWNVPSRPARPDTPTSRVKPAHRPAPLRLVVDATIRPPRMDPRGKPYTTETVGVRMCRWPLGDEAASQTYCAHETAVGAIYCLGHQRRASNPQSRGAPPKPIPREILKAFGGS